VVAAAEGRKARRRQHGVGLGGEGSEVLDRPVKLLEGEATGVVVVDLVDGVLEDLPCPLRVLGVELHTVLERLDLEVALPRRAAAAHRRRRIGLGAGWGGHWIQGRAAAGKRTDGEKTRQSTRRLQASVSSLSLFFWLCCLASLSRS
jgi:hypothetical protein